MKIGELVETLKKLYRLRDELHSNLSEIDSLKEDSRKELLERYQKALKGIDAAIAYYEGLFEQSYPKEFLDAAGGNSTLFEGIY